MTTANGDLSMPITAHFVWTPLGKAMSDKHLLVTPNQSPPPATVSMSVPMFKDANGAWQVRQ